MREQEKYSEIFRAPDNAVSTRRLSELTKSLVQENTERIAPISSNLKIARRAVTAVRAMPRALSGVGECKSNPLLGHERKGYNLIVEDKWAKRGGQLARSRQRATEEKRKRNSAVGGSESASFPNASPFESATTSSSLPRKVN